MGKKRKYKKSKRIKKPAFNYRSKNAVNFLPADRSVHDKITKNLEERLTPKMDSSYRNVEYCKPEKYVIGELDYIAYREKTNTLYIFEVKTSDNYKLRGKAKDQLYRATQRFVPEIFKEHFPENVQKVVTIYVGGTKQGDPTKCRCKCMGVYDLNK